MERILVSGLRFCSNTELLTLLLLLLLLLRMVLDMLVIVDAVAKSDHTDNNRTIASLIVVGSKGASSFHLFGRDIF